MALLNADHTDITEMMNKLRASGNRMVTMDDDVGNAITVKEIYSDGKENLLSIYVKKYLEQGKKSKAEAEVYSRCDPEYISQFNQMTSDLRDANKILRKAKTEDKINDCGRSLLSASKGIKDGLMG